MRIKAFAVAALCTFIVGIAAPAHAAKYKIHWYLGHPNLDAFEEAAANFKKDVETRSKGDIEVQIITAAQDGAASGPEIATKVENGEVEMGHSFTDVVSSFDKRLMAFEAPYLMRDERHMEGIIEGPVGAELMSGLRAHHIVGLSFTYSGGASGVATTGREIRRPEDLKGLKVGVYGDKVNEAWLSSLGATPVPIEHKLSSINQLAHEGKLDAVVVTWRNFDREKLDHNFKYVNLMGSTYLVSMTYINEKFFNSLPAEYQTLIKNASRAAGIVERARTVDLNESAKRALLARGVRQVRLTEAGKSAFVSALKPAYERSIDGLIGKELLERIRSTPASFELTTTAKPLAAR